MVTKILKVKPGIIQRKLVAVAVKEPVKAEGALLFCIPREAAIRVHNRQPPRHLERPWPCLPPFVYKAAQLDITPAHLPGLPGSPVPNPLGVEFLLPADSPPVGGRLEQRLGEIVVLGRDPGKLITAVTGKATVGRPAVDYGEGDRGKEALAPLEVALAER